MEGLFTEPYNCLHIDARLCYKTVRPKIEKRVNDLSSCWLKFNTQLPTKQTKKQYRFDVRDGVGVM